MKTDAANLTLLKDNRPDSVYFLSADRPTSLGRSPENDIVLSDPRCSRLHATIEKRGDAWFLIDRSSRNGTAVNDRLVDQEIQLHEGDQIQLAHTLFTFNYSLAPPEGIIFNDEISHSPRHYSETLAESVDHIPTPKELTRHLNRVRDENRALRFLLGQESEIIGESEAVKKVLQLIDRVSESNATVLIRGESGVGKELVARMIHFASPRKGKPLICLNCAALSETLLESELFGHEKGAFTGATERKIGKFEAADGGTLFLDEIAEMNPGLQAKFLRVLEKQPFERVGGNKPINVDVRVIAATNRDLEKEVTEGRFRHDLFFRLHVLEIPVPPLRKRPDDILPLAEFFLKKYSIQMNQRFTGFSPEAAEMLACYRWPGNVRELKNMIERAVLLGVPPLVLPDDLFLSNLRTTGNTSFTRIEAAQTSSSKNGFVPQTIDEMEENLIRQTLDYFGWNKSKTAKSLGIERTTLDRKIARFGIARSNNDDAR